MTTQLFPDQFPILNADQLPERRFQALDDETLAQAREIVDDIRREGEPALLRHAQRLGDLASPQHGTPSPETPSSITLSTQDLRAALDRIPANERKLLERTAARIRDFAAAQRACLKPLRFPIPGGEAGHDCLPIERAGCYAPGGRFALPSSVLMTAITARAAGVREVWVASPRPTDTTLAAAALAEADGFIAVGGAQAIAALTFGIAGPPPCDIIVGPGNRWVTAAKQLVSGTTGIDMLAGPSELVVLADDSANPRTIAADLLAQAEHDADAAAILVTTSKSLATASRMCLAEQLESLPTRAIAAEALRNSFAILADDLESALRTCDTLAPEHLQVMTRNPAADAARIRHCGALFIGHDAAEVLGDYGAGPNHVLPTSGTARFRAGLSIFTFMRIRTWLRIDSPTQSAPLLSDAVALARIEGLEAHARAAQVRQPSPESIPQ